MRITLLFVGKTAKGWTSEGLSVYLDRLSHYVSLDVKEIPELKNAASLSQEQVKRKEGEQILQSLRSDDRVILLDEKGKEYSSIQFAEQLNRYMNEGKNIVFVIGGPYGFSPEVYARAQGGLSLGRMTLSHQMVRIVFAEQLYRAFTIIRGEPYHHE